MKPQKKKQKISLFKPKDVKKEKKLKVKPRSEEALRGQKLFLHYYFKAIVDDPEFDFTIPWVDTDFKGSKHFEFNNFEFDDIFEKLVFQNNNNLITKLTNFHNQSEEFQLTIVDILFYWCSWKGFVKKRRLKEKFITFVERLPVYDVIDFLQEFDITVHEMFNKNRHIYNDTIMAILFDDPSDTVLHRRNEMDKFDDTMNKQFNSFELSSPLLTNKETCIPSDVMEIVFSFLDMTKKDNFTNYLSVNSLWNLKLLLILPRLNLDDYDCFSIPTYAFAKIKEINYDIKNVVQNDLLYKQYMIAFKTVEIINSFERGNFLFDLHRIVTRYPNITLPKLHTLLTNGHLNDWTTKENLPELQNLTMPLHCTWTDSNTEILKQLIFLNCGYKLIKGLKFVMEKMNEISLYRQPARLLGTTTTVLDTFKSFIFMTKQKKMVAKFPNLEKLYMCLYLVEFMEIFDGLIFDINKLFEEFNVLHPQLKTIIVKFVIIGRDYEPKPDIDINSIIISMRKFKEFFPKCQVCFSNIGNILYRDVLLSDKMIIAAIEKENVICVSRRLQGHWENKFHTGRDSIGQLTLWKIRNLKQKFQTEWPSTGTVSQLRFTNLKQIFGLDPLNEFTTDIVVIVRNFEIDLTVHPYGKRMKIWRELDKIVNKKKKLLRVK